MKFFQLSILSIFIFPVLIGCTHQVKLEDISDHSVYLEGQGWLYFSPNQRVRNELYYLGDKHLVTINSILMANKRIRDFQLPFGEGQYFISDDATIGILYPVDGSNKILVSDMNPKYLTGSEKKYHITETVEYWKLKKISDNKYLNCFMISGECKVENSKLNRSLLHFIPGNFFSKKQ